MARFRGTVQGGRTQASRLGHAKTGLVVECNGWNGGIHVEAKADGGDDCFEVTLSCGSNGPNGWDNTETVLGEFRVTKDGLRTWAVPGSPPMEEI